MKKFLSLVLALVMTFSLVTIGAGATEYKDLTDKNEITYEEAVAVLNKLGIISGYSDGSFNPTGTLTRGAAAKIIVSLMIGPEAASALSVSTAPYSDVPANHTFAGVISYCKTAGYINGYSDGTFRPSAPLTGYAFAKMLLGALGYDGKIEGFSGSGWTMNVASVGTVAGLFNDFVTPFQGNNGVTREQACQLALNTLKATQVEYKGNNINVTTGDANVSITDQNHTDVVNNSNTDGNIIKNVLGYAAGKDGKMQFAEQHFVDLKELSDTTTTYNRPATRWAYKNVTIGKFAKVADFTFTAAPSGDTAKDKVEDLGLNGYKLYSGTNVSVNGVAVSASDMGCNVVLDSAKKTTDSAVAQNLVNLFGNGILVEVYLDEDNADIISDIVVIRTQLMKVGTVSSKNVTLKQLDEVGNDDDPTTTATDKYYKPVSTVKDDDDAYADLKNYKSDDYVLVTYDKDGSSQVVQTVATPVVVTGALTAITRNNSNKVNSVTVGGTKYSLAAIRDDDFATLDAAKITASKKDVTLYLDAYGYATYIKDAGSTSNFMIYGNDYQSLVNGKLVTTLTGWDMKGNEVSITVNSNGGAKYGDLLKYTSVTTSSSSYDYTVSKVNGISAGTKSFELVKTTDSYEIKAGNTTVTATTGTAYNIASGIKTIFLDFEDDNTVKSISVKNGLANITNSELQDAPVGGNAAQMYVNKDGAVEAVIVKTTSSDAVSDKVLYIESVKGDSLVDGVKTYTYHVWVDGAEDDYTSTDKLSAGTFATYAEASNGNYKLSAVNKTDGVTSAFKLTIDKGAIVPANKSLIYKVNVNNGILSSDINYPIYKMDDTRINTADSENLSNVTLNTNGAEFSDLTDHGISSIKDIWDLYESGEIASGKVVDLVIVMNNKSTSDDYLKVSAVAVVDIR